MNMLVKRSFYIIFAIVGLFLIAAAGFVYFSFIDSKPTLRGNKNIYTKNSEDLSVDEKKALEKSAVLFFGGDVMLARNVQTIQENLTDYKSAWKNIFKEMSRADLAVINLESPFSPRGPYPDAGFIFRARPENMLGLKQAGIDVVNLANNHFGNAGLEGMNYTFDFLTENKIVYTGAGRDEAEAFRAKLVEVKDLKIAFLSQGYDAGSASGENQPGIAFTDLEKLTEEINKIRDQADLVIVQFHGGVEYTHQPNKEQVLFAHKAVDAGADLVIGHHPHWVQEIEKYQGRYIFYSLGNLIFDQNWSQKTSEGLVVGINIKNGLIDSFDLKPVVIENNYQPRWANEIEAGRILKYINITSTSLFL